MRNTMRGYREHVSSVPRTAESEVFCILGYIKYGVFKVKGSSVSFPTNKSNRTMPPPQLPRVEELEFWSTGEKLATREKFTSVHDTVTISAELYERVIYPGS